MLSWHSTYCLRMSMHDWGALISIDSGDDMNGMKLHISAALRDLLSPHPPPSPSPPPPQKKRRNFVWRDLCNADNSSWWLKRINGVRVSTW